MHQVSLSDTLYSQAAQRATAAGYATVDEYVAEIVADDAANDDMAAENLDHFFTPERLAEIDATVASIRAGAKTYSAEEVREHLDETRRAWMRANGQ